MPVMVRNMRMVIGCSEIFLPAMVCSRSFPNGLSPKIPMTNGVSELVKAFEGQSVNLAKLYKNAALSCDSDGCEAWLRARGAVISNPSPKTNNVIFCSRMNGQKMMVRFILNLCRRILSSRMLPGRLVRIFAESAGFQRPAHSQSFPTLAGTDRLTSASFYHLKIPARRGALMAGGFNKGFSIRLPTLTLVGSLLFLSLHLSA